MKDIINVGIIGFGTVGCGAAGILIGNGESIARKVGAQLLVKRIADIDMTTPRPIEVDKSILTTNADDVINDPRIDIVVETIGGVTPAGDFIRRALRNGKHVVTANKELIAKEGQSLLPLASELGRDLMFEASVGGGIPIVRPLKCCLAGNDILEIKGIVNGTTNYILTRMAAEGLDYEQVLPDAQAKGYAESDPTADVEGHDAAYKISILASIAFTSRADVARVHREGITRIASEDIAYARELGYVIKLLAIAKQVDGAIQARVHPAFVPKGHPLSTVDGVFNAIYIKGSAVGEVMFYGPGAGAGAAGSAVVGDVIDVARNIRFGSTSRIPCTCFDEREMLTMDSVTGKNYIRIVASDRPRVLAAIANVFADNDVSIESVLQKVLPESKAEIVWITHEAAEPNVRVALDSIRDLPVVEKVASWIRVEE
ncbi:MAG: homoserine dehydrogenase [Armatimonadetes bacterium RBG_16_58_9]|nr:MAG: homoserine dehydrogenase [Armatimonadetes bacterium RBG_16_58_9]